MTLIGIGANCAKGLSRLNSFGLCQRRLLSVTASAKAKESLDIGGVYPAMPTPFNKDESIAYDKFASNIATWNKIPYRGLVVQGSNGEYVHLSSAERVELVKRAREFLPSDSNKLLLAGSGCQSTQATIEMSEKMAKAGADAVMVVTPSYYKGGMTDKALRVHFTAVADNSPVPVILYSVPPFTIIDVSLDLIVELAHHPNIIGVKESGGDITKIGAIVHRTQGVEFNVLAGSVGYFMATLNIGGVGIVSALANVLGDELYKLYKLVKDGNVQAAVDLQKKLIGPNYAVTKDYGIPGLKQVMDWMGMYGGPTRLPLQPVPESDLAKLRKAFVDAGYL